MLRTSSVVLGCALAMALTAGASLAQSPTQERVPWAAGSEPTAQTKATQVAAVDKSQAVPPLPIRNAVFAAKDAEAKATGRAR